MDAMDSSYQPPLALTVISGIFLAIGAISAIGISLDIVSRKGWQTMMGIMIPVYIINATYLGPFAVFIYYRYGRPVQPTAKASDPAHKEHQHTDPEKGISSECSSQNEEPEERPGSSHCSHSETPREREQVNRSSDTNVVRPKDDQEGPHHVEEHACHSSTRPFWATVTSGVFHCGAGCVLGDIVGEWIVYGTGATISGRMIWPELLIDYAFALLFGIVFQYFSIAPMSGNWGPMSFWRAAKADIASLTSFEIGAFAWMIAFQVGIFGDKLGMDTWSYWFMMQIGMCLGVVTAWPANWWLLKHNVKEACC